MSSRSTIYNVAQDYYALSLNVMLERRSDVDLCGEGNEDEVMNLYTSITNNIIDCKGKPCISGAYILGGREDQIKIDFQKSLVKVTQEIINDELLSHSQVPYDVVLVNLATAVQ
ncbi:unnamed protein product, partial [Rotaria magnacalcarata]